MRTLTATGDAKSQILAGWNPTTQTFSLDSSALAALGLGDFATAYLSSGLTLTVAQAPVVDATDTHISVTGTMSYGNPGSTNPGTVSFGALAEFDLSDAASISLVVQLQAQSTGWWSDFFPDLANTYLGSLVLQGTPPGEMFLASSACSCTDGQTTLTLSQGLNLRVPVAVGQSFADLSALIAHWDTVVEFFGPLTLQTGGYSFLLAADSDFSYPWQGFAPTFSAALAATGGSGFPSAEIVFSISTTVGAEGAVSLSARYMPAAGQLTFVTATKPSGSSPISLADLAGLMPSAVANSIADALPQQVLSGLDAVMSVFSLSYASIAIAPATPAVNSVGVGLNIAAGTPYSAPVVKFPVGDATIDSVSLQVDIASPISSPAVSVQLAASGTLVGAAFSVAANASEASFVLQPGGAMSLGGFVGAFTGLDASSAPGWQFDVLQLDVTTQPSMTVSGSLAAASIPPLSVGDWTLSIGALDAAITVAEGGGTGGSLSGAVTVGEQGQPDMQAAFNVVVGNDWVGSFSLDLASSDTLFQALAGTGIPLVPDIPLTALQFQVASGNTLSFEVDFGKLDIAGQDFLVIDSAKAVFDYSPAGLQLSLDITGSASGTWFSIDTFTASIRYDSTAKTWSSTDSIDATLFGKTLQLNLAISGSPGAETLSFAYAGDLAAITIDALSISVSALQLTLQEKANALSLSFENQFQFAIGSLDTVAATLDLNLSDQNQDLTLNFEEGTSFKATLCSFGDVSPTLAVELTQLGLKHDGQGWSVSLTTGLAVSGLPGFLFDVGILLEATPDTPYPYQVTISASGENGVTITIPTLLDAHSFDLSLDIGGVSIPLHAWDGTQVSIGDVTGVLSDQPSLGFDASLTLPGSLASLLGTSPNFFSQNPFSMSFSIGYADGSPDISFSFNAIPFLEQYVKEVTTSLGNGWELDLGACGKLTISVPMFAFDANTMGFKSVGWIQGLDTLAIPLKPLKTLLQQTPASAVAGVLPDAPIPLLPSISFLDGSGNLNFDAIVKFFSAPPWSEFISQDLLDAMRTLLSDLTLSSSDLPSRMLPYLDLTFPDEFGWNIDLGSSGSINLQFTAGARGGPANGPIRLLLPCLAGPPSLLGMTVYGISLGPVFAGALFQLTLDCDIDQFDISEIVAAKLLQNCPVPSAASLQRTITIDSFYMVVFYEDAGIPIPIPLFFDDLGIDYLGIEGAGLHAHAYFPMPQLGLGTVLSAVGNLYDFCKGFPNAPFPEDPFGETQIVFELHDWYLNVPQYLGGGIAGKQGMVLDLNVFKDVAEMFNAIRTVDLLAIVAALPASVTSGSVSASLSSIEVDAQWSVAAKDSPKSLSVQLSGGCSAASLTQLSGTFDLAASDASGFAVSYALSGTLSPLAASIGGGLIIDPHADPQFAAQAESTLSLLGYPMLSGNGSVAYQSDELQLTESLSLFPSDMPFHITSSGHGSIGSNGFHYDCGAQVAGLAIFPINGRGSDGVSVTIDSSGDALAILMFGTLDWGNLQVSLGIQTQGSVVLFGGKVSDSILNAYLTLFFDTGNATASTQLDAQTLSIEGTSAASLTAHFSDAVNGGAGSFTAQVAGFDIFSGSVSDQGSSLSVSGQFRLLSLMTIGASGTYDAGNISLSASDSVDIDLIVGRVTFEVGAELGNNGVSLGMSGDVEVGLKIHGIGLTETFRCSGMGTIGAGPSIAFSLSGSIKIPDPIKPWDHITITLSFTVYVTESGVSIQNWNVSW